jgi:hypothetical protein
MPEAEIVVRSCVRTYDQTKSAVRPFESLKRPADRLGGPL